ncbi:MAG: AAA family ATPase [Deltaproteobacteria bacterium]|nr:AAA family ATPase [Deltaproteobacteria bacterium]
MLKKELILRNPLRQLGFETEDILSAGEFGAVLAHAGVGKTALLVQLAMNGMLRSRNVLHISLNDPVNKVNLWYNELFHHLAGSYEGAQTSRLWESVLPHRFIMTFRVESFTVPKLKERLNDLTVQGIFSPAMMIIDGLHFDESLRADLNDLKALAAGNGMHVWFTVHTHRHESPGKDGLPGSFSAIAGLFDLVLELQPEHADVHIKRLRGKESSPAGPALLLDPSTMLIKDNRI